MREYETTFIVRPEISDEGGRTILSKLDGVLESGGATRLMCEDHGKRKLAYEIRKFHKGHYYVLSFLDDGQVIPAFERVLRLNESVLRFMTIQTDPDVTDVEARKVVAVEAAAEQVRKAEERAVREEEEAKARAEIEHVAAEEAAAAAREAAAAAEEAAPADGDSEEPAAAETEGAEAAKSDAKDAAESSKKASDADEAGDSSEEETS